MKANETKYTLSTYGNGIVRPGEADEFAHAQSHTDATELIAELNRLSAAEGQVKGMREALKVSGQSHESLAILLRDPKSITELGWQSAQRQCVKYAKLAEDALTLPKPAAGEAGKASDPRLDHASVELLAKHRRENKAPDAGKGERYINPNLEHESN